MFDEPRTTVKMEAILSRDQRTTFHRVLDCPVVDNHQQREFSYRPARILPRSTGNHFRSDKRTDMVRGEFACAVALAFDDRGIRSRRRISSSSCRAIPITTTWLRLGGLLVILSCVMTVQGAPTMSHENNRLSTPPKWVNPCGLAADDIEDDTEIVQLGDEQLLNQVVVQAKTALTHAGLFRDDYIRQTFNTDFADLHSTWKDNHYDWLPGPKEIPKQLGEQLNQEFLDKLELDTALLDAYEYMQKYAVGLEQIVWDQEDLRLEFRNQFKDTEFRLRTVLCELQVALVERMVPLRPDVTRDAMSSEYRSMSEQATYRNLRDWLIFRDYMNGLEYVVQVFEHLRQKVVS